jgi:putative hydrolase of the HAD superfamily
VNRALLFDLDETLVVEEAAIVASFVATASAAATVHELDAAALALAARARARELWYAAPTHPYCRRVGISSWEGLWCRYEGDDPQLRRLRDFAPAYRREAWTLALADQGVEDGGLAEALGERFAAERRARHEAFADAEPVLRELATSHELALVTNGASCLQREKLLGSGLGEFFEVVVVSGDHGTAKPDPAIFARAVAQLRDGEDAVMIGDSFERDIEGALAAGLGAVWLNRSGRAAPDVRDGVPQIATLSELPALLRNGL